MTDWQKGDLALCVYSLLGNHTGKIFTVREIIFGKYRGARGVLALRFVDFDDPGHGGAWHHAAFRRIPPHTPDAEDAETIRLLTSQPAQVTV